MADTNDESLGVELDGAQLILIGKQEVPMSTLMEGDVSDISPFAGFTAFPAGVYDFSVVGARLEMFESQTVGDKAVIRLELACAHVHAVKDKSVDPEELIGRDYSEMVFINDVGRDIGKVRHIIENAGGKWGGSLVKNLADFAENVDGFTAGVTSYYHKEKDRTYTNLDLKTIKPLVKAPAAPAAPKLG